MDYIYLKDVNYNSLFNNFNLCIKKKVNISVIGPSESGKSTFLKILAGDIFTKNNVNLNGIEINLANILSIKKDIALIINNNIYMEEIVIDELRYYVSNLIIKPDEVEERLDRITNYFDLAGILDSRIEDLKYSDRVLISILKHVLLYPKILLLDEVVDYLSNDDCSKLFKYLDDLDINYIYSTCDLEKTLFSEYIVCLYNGFVAIEGRTLEVLKEEKIMKRLGFNLPFYVDLSIQLKYYGLLDNIYLNKEDLVGSLWG